MKLASHFGNTSLSHYTYIQRILKCVYSPLIICVLQQKVSHYSFLIYLTESNRVPSTESVICKVEFTSKKNLDQHSFRVMLNKVK